MDRSENVTIQVQTPVQIQTLLSCMDGGVCVVCVGEKLICKYASPAYYEMPGSSKEYLKDGISEDFLKNVHPADRARLENTLRNGVESEIPTRCDYRIKNENGIFYRSVRVMHAPNDGDNMPSVLCVIRDNTHERQVADDLAKGNAQLNIALERMKAYLWEVDIATASFRIWDSSSQSFKKNTVFSPVPECFTERNWVYPEFIHEVNSFFADMLEGKREGQCACIMRQIDGNRFSWVKMSYVMHYDENGEAEKAVGISERFPNILDEKSRFEQEEKLIEAVKDKLVAALKVNITAETLESIYIRGDSLIEKNDIKTCGDIFKENIRVMINDEDIARYCAKMNPSILNNAYEHGSDCGITEYRRKDKFGNVKWVFTSCLLMTEPVTGELYAFVYVMDKDALKRWELALPIRVEVDPATQLYSRETARAIMRGIIETKNKTDLRCALMIVDFEGMKDIINRISYSVASRMILSLGRLFRLLLNKDCVIGREGEFRFSVFVPVIASSKRAYEMAQELIDEVEYLRDHASMHEPLTFSVGIAVGKRDSVDSIGMYTRAVQACAQAIASNEKYHICVAEEDENAIRQNVISVPETQDDRPLTQDENEVYAKCLSLLLRADVFMDAATEVLHLLGGYYAAERVCVLTLDEKKTTLRRAHEWEIPRARMSMERMRRTHIENNPQIFKVVTECNIYFLDEHEAHSAKEYCGGERHVALPIIGDNGIAGILALENVGLHLQDTALLAAVIPAMLTAYKKNRLISEKPGDLQHDRLTGLLDRDACMQFIRSTNGETVSTFGILFTDVNGLSAVNQQMGIDYGDNLIRFAASTVLSEFMSNEVYRYSGDELLVLCQDVTHEEFMRRCDSIRKVCDNVYPGRISIGCTWADVDINILKMLDHAVKLATISKQSYYLSEVHGSKHLQSEALKLLMEHLEKKRFQVWFQPKANVLTGEIVGAEALVRLLDPQRGIVGPQEFIPVFERGNAIRELDFFVLDETLKTMQRWKDEGKIIVPVSVNYSRATLLDPTALETTLSIFHRYSIGQDMLEIEITESIGEMEHATIGQACGKLRENGFRLALDDFGSAYSSMAVLANVPFDAVKVDKSIINSIVTNRVSRSIVESTLRICKETGAGCIAEGVETAEQAQAQLGVGCAQAQGYFYNKPMNAEAFSHICLKEKQK